MDQSPKSPLWQHPPKPPEGKPTPGQWFELSLFEPRVSGCGASKRCRVIIHRNHISSKLRSPSELCARGGARWGVSFTRPAGTPEDPPNQPSPRERPRGRPRTPPLISPSAFRLGLPTKKRGAGRPWEGAPWEALGEGAKHQPEGERKRPARGVGWHTGLGG